MTRIFSDQEVSHANKYSLFTSYDLNDKSNLKNKVFCDKNMVA